MLVALPSAKCLCVPVPTNVLVTGGCPRAGYQPESFESGSSIRIISDNNFELQEAFKSGREWWITVPLS